VTSLPGEEGIGDLGPTAYEFIDWLHGAKQSIWQVLPLGPTGYGDSPYATFSAFAGNPLLLSLQALVEQGALSRAEAARAPEFSDDHVDYGAVVEYKMPLLRKASCGGKEFDDFCEREGWWLDDFALFMALKEANGGVAWHRWTNQTPAPGAELAHKSIQFWFSRQWRAVKSYANGHGIRIMGDVPIYVAHDSADVWAHREFFRLRETGEPEFVAGVPPDYFSATGQLWGNPIYRWDVLERDGYRWWIERLRATFAQVDLVRLDHFRGFEAYWEVPGCEQTAIRGKWVKGPGSKLFRVLTRELGDLAIVAENLGVITPEVEAIRHEFEFPGMSILQFAFGDDPQAPTFRPHNYPCEIVAYTGTHDNDTTVGWWNSAAEANSVRTEAQIEAEHEYTRRYLDTDGREIHWDFIRALMASVANTVLFPLQDVLGLGTDARMNIPSTASGNWTWRCRRDALTRHLQARLMELTTTYERGY
jgi:4-alpha-glucanotransferase